MILPNMNMIMYLPGITDATPIPDKTEVAAWKYISIDLLNSRYKSTS